MSIMVIEFTIAHLYSTKKRKKNYETDISNVLIALY